MRLPILLLLIAGAACTSSACPPSSPNSPDDCARAEAKIKALKCSDPSGAPLWQTAKGVPFSEVCRQTPADWHPARVALITDCSQLNQAIQGTP